MTLFDLTLTQLATFLAVSSAAVLALYMLRLRRRTVLVSFAPLWRNAVRDRSATSLLERLRRILSVLLQIAFVALLLFAIARPRISGDVERERRFVVVIDVSAAMQATDADGRSQLEAAKALARDLVAQLGESDRALLLRAGVQAEALTAFEGDRDVLLRGIDAIEADDCASDLDGAVRFARKLVAMRPARVFVFTERPRADTEVTWRCVGARRDNVAVTRFAARSALESPGEYELLFAVKNFGRRDAEVRLRIETDEAPPALIAERPMRLVPGGAVSEIIRGIVREDMRLRARLVTDDDTDYVDALAVDNRAFTVLRAPRVVRVTVVGKENRFLSSVLASDPLVRWKRVDVYDPDDDADVVIFDRVAAPVDVARAIVIAPTGDSPVKHAGTVTSAFVDHLADEHPVMRFVGELADLNIAHSQVLVAGPGDVVLASCAGSPVMLARERDASRLLVLGFGLSESDLVLRVAFPKIVRNALAWLSTGETVPGVSTFRAGERSLPVKAGFHERGGRTIAVNLSDPGVSDLRARPDAAATPEAVRIAAAGGLGTELWPMLALSALVLTLFEAFSYHRRWTV